MNHFMRKIEKNIHRKKIHKGIDVFEGIVFSLVKKTGMSLDDILEAPTPLILALNLKLHSYYEEKNKQMKK